MDGSPRPSSYGTRRPGAFGRAVGKACRVLQLPLTLSADGRGRSGNESQHVRIDPRSPAQRTAAGARRETSGSGFDLAARGGDVRSTAGAGGAASLASLDAILTLQAMDEPGERKRRSARRGRDLLDSLDLLKAGLLSGTVSTAELARIASGLRTGAGPSGDPGLDGVVAEIELRAKVELAKLGRADLI